MTQLNTALRPKREKMTNTMLLMTISIIIFIGLYIYAVLNIQGFEKAKMFVDLINENAPTIIIACSLTIVMIGGGIDISVGGVIILTVMSCARFLNESTIADPTLRVIVTLLLALGIGLCFGLMQGFLVSYLEIQPFIVTLAGMVLAKGVASMLFEDWKVLQKALKVRNITNPKVAHEGFKALQNTKIEIPWLGYISPNNGKLIPAKIEMGAVIAIVVVICVFLMLRYVKKGRHIYAVGGNQQSAMMLGVNVKATRFFSYIMSGTLAGLAGFVYLIHDASANITSVGVRYEMDAIASSIIGGTLLTGGVGNVIGSFFGTMILVTLKKVIKLDPNIKVSYIQEMASGAMLGLFIILQSIILSIRGKGKIQLPSWLKFGSKKGGGDSLPPPEKDNTVKA